MTGKNEDRGEGERLSDRVTDEGSPYAIRSGGDDEDAAIEDVEEGDLAFPEPRNVSHIELMNGRDDDESEDGVAAADWEWDDDTPAHDHAEHDHAELEPIDELDDMVHEMDFTAAANELKALGATKEAKRLLHVALRNGATQIETPRAKVVRLTDPSDGAAYWKVYRIDYEDSERAVDGHDAKVWTAVEKIPEDDIRPGYVTGAVPVSPGRLEFPFGPRRSLDGLHVDLEAHRDTFRYGRFEAGSEEWRDGVAAGIGYAMHQLEEAIDVANEEAARRIRGLLDTDTNTDR